MKNGMKRTLLAFMVMAMLASSTAVPAMASDGESNNLPASTTVSYGEENGANGAGASVTLYGAGENGAQTSKQLPAESNGKVTIIEDGTYTLTKNVNYPVVVNSGVTATIDLAGFSIQATGDHAITNNGILTITGNGTVDTSLNKKAALYNTGTIVVNGGTFTRSQENSNSNTWYYIYNEKNASMTLNSCSVPGISSTSSTLCNWGTLTINDGVTISSQRIAVKNDETGTLYLNGGTITSPNQAVQNWYNATISGGTMTGSVTTWAYEYRGQVYAGHTVMEGGSADSIILASMGSPYLLTNGNVVPSVSLTGTAQVGDVFTQIGGDAADEEHSYGSITISGRNALIGNVFNAGNHTTITIDNALIASVTNNGAGSISIKHSDIRGNVSENGTGSISIDGESTVSGNISGDVDYNLSVAFEGLGTQSYAYGSVITIPEGPSFSDRFAFIGWSDGSRLWYPGQSYTVTGNVSFEAVFDVVSTPDYDYTPPEKTEPKNGWVQRGSKWYLYDNDEKLTGWQKVGNTWYYMDEKGVMLCDGLTEIDGETYYFYDWGGMASSWWYEDENGDWYYFRGNGAMAKNSWIEWKGKYYYVGADGKMLTGTTTPDGYYVNWEGVWIP